jgi:ADP-ribosylglycohydrolase
MIEKFRGAILGYAIGDALGMPVEGMSREDIKRIYGEVTDFMPSPLGDLKAGEWTDDTEQTILLAKSILETVYFSPEKFAEKLKNLTSSRIGPTTKIALKNLTFGAPRYRAGVESETCGSAMRVMPIGLIYSFSLDLVEKYAVLSSIVTHKGSAVSGAVAVAVAVACIFNELEDDRVLKEVVSRTKKYDELVADKVSYAYQISDKDVDFAVDRLGNSMSVYESVPFAFYCYFSTSSFRECAVKAVNAGGDADTISAIACGMMGCKVGVDGIPKEWIEKVRDADLLIDLADKLHDLYLMISSIG